MAKLGLALALAVAAIVVALLLSRGPETAQPTPSSRIWPEAFALEPGQDAVGSGVLVGSHDGSARLCTGEEIVALPRGGEFKCNSTSVSVRDIDVASIPGARHEDGVHLVMAIVLRGRWDGEALSVRSIGGSFPPVTSTSPLECREEVPGASREPLPLAQREAESARLQAEIEDHKDVYGGLWMSTEGDRIQIVATTGPVLEAGVRLRGLFSSRLCVVAVRHSLRELERLASAFPAMESRWRTQIAVERNRVVVWFPVLDQAAVTALGALPDVDARPLLVKD